MFLRLSLCLLLGVLVNLSSQTCFKPDFEQLLEVVKYLENKQQTDYKFSLFSQVKYHENKRRGVIKSINIDSLDIKMKNDQQFSDLLSEACSSQGIGRELYHIDPRFTYFKIIPVDRHLGVQPGC